LRAKLQQPKKSVLLALRSRRIELSKSLRALPFPSWFIGRLPERRVIEISYGDRFAKKFGRANRRLVEEFGKELFDIEVSRENRSVTNWGISRFPGGMISAGVNSHITGEGADLLVINDPIKNRKEANPTNIGGNLKEERSFSRLVLS
jgi:hypothetical protein